MNSYLAYAVSDDSDYRFAGRHAKLKPALMCARVAARGRQDWDWVVDTQRLDGYDDDGKPVYTTVARRSSVAGYERFTPNASLQPAARSADRLEGDVGQESET